MTQSGRSLGQILVEKGLLAQASLERALEVQQGTARRLGEILVEMGELGEEGLRWALAEQMDLPLVHPDPEALDPDALALVEPDLCRRYAVLPLYLDAGEGGRERTLTLAAAGPSRKGGLEDLARRSGCAVRVVASLREEIESVLERLYGPAPGEDVAIGRAGLGEAELAEVRDDPTGDALLRRLLLGALDAGAGGVNLRCERGTTRVEAAGGGSVFEGGAAWHAILLDRLRQLGNLPARERQPLQRGRFSLVAQGGAEPLMFRVSILRGVEGEEAQVRLLQPEGRPRTLAELGLRSHQALEIRRCLEKPGLIWVTAATEEGLASTLFALLREVPGSGRGVTVEEEVHYRSPELLQVETGSLEGAERSRLLGELQHLDFDRVLVDRVGPGQLGELLGLALRRRWVFAGGAEASLEEALHSLAARSQDVPLYGLRLVVHQRLVPILCPECREACVLGTGERQALARMLKPDASAFQEGDGCRSCGGRGVQGARAFFAVLPVDAAAREAIYAQSRGEQRVGPLAAAVAPSIREQVAAAVAAGEVSLSELWDLL